MLQRFVYFFQNSGQISIYREDDTGFRYGFPIAVTALSELQQTVVAAAMAWQAAQFEPDEVLQQVIFEPYAIDDSTVGLIGAATGRKAGYIGRERTITTDSKNLPQELRAGLIGLWLSLADVPDPVEPEPQPAPEPEDPEPDPE